VLLTLLVLWVVVVPALTIAGAYVLSGSGGDRLRQRGDLTAASANRSTRILQDRRATPDAFVSCRVIKMPERVQTSQYAYFVEH
jgi:hypothetical protein